MADLFFTTLAQFQTISPEEFARFAAALVTTLVLGIAFIVTAYLKLGAIADARDAAANRGAGDNPARAAAIVASAPPGRHEPGPPRDANGAALPAPGGGVWRVPGKARRSIPLGAAATLVARAQRLEAERSFPDALTNYLSLLYSATEQGGCQTLPAHLTDCLRGAANCYRETGDLTSAVRFYQAERLVYEEMVAGALGASEERAAERAAAGTRIISSLLAGAKPSAAGGAADAPPPRRCEVLSDVAAASLKYGYNHLGLSYRVKAAALRHKMSGEPMDPESQEFQDIAKALELCGDAIEANQRREQEEADRREGSGDAPRAAADGGAANAIAAPPATAAEAAPVAPEAVAAPPPAAAAAVALVAADPTAEQAAGPAAAEPTKSKSTPKRRAR